MASSYSADLQLELMVTGEKSGLWGDITNENLTILQQAIAGYEAISIAGGAKTTALTFSNGAISNGKNAVIKFTGVITGNQVVTIPDGIEKIYIIENGTTGAFTVEFKTVSGTGFELTQGKISACFSDGTNVTEVALNTLGGELSAGSITATQLATDAVTTVKIQNAAVTVDKLATNSVGTTQIVNDAVTAAKLQRKFTISTASPTGGSDGDLWFKYS